MTDSKTAHIVETPQYFFFIRIAQFLLSIVILGLVGYTIDYYGGGRRTWGLEELGFLVFCVCFQSYRYYDNFQLLILLAVCMDLARHRIRLCYDSMAARCLQYVGPTCR